MILSVLKVNIARYTTIEMSYSFYDVKYTKQKTYKQLLEQINLMSKNKTFYHVPLYR